MGEQADPWAPEVDHRPIPISAAEQVLRLQSSVKPESAVRAFHMDHRLLDRIYDALGTELEQFRKILSDLVGSNLG